MGLLLSLMKFRVSLPEERGDQSHLCLSQEETLNTIKSQTCQRVCLSAASWKNFLKFYLH